MKAIGIALMLAIVLTMGVASVAGAQGPVPYYNGGTYYGYQPQPYYTNGYSGGNAYALPCNSSDPYNRFGGGYFPPYRRFGGGYAYGPYLRFGGGYVVTPSSGWSYTGY